MKGYTRSLKLVAFESIITAGLLSMPIMTPFFLSIGLNQEQIALSQMIFTIVVLVLNIPMGWIADRFSRKWANVIGDLGSAASLLLYSQVQDFAGVVICEILLGIFLALSKGVDASLIKHFANKADETGRLFKTVTAKVSAWQFVCILCLMFLGGPIGAISFRLAVGLSAVTCFIGGVVSIFVKDDSENLVQKHRNPLKDMAVVSWNAIKNPSLRLRIFAFAVTKEVTHGIIWVFTPLMLLAGVPLAVTSLGWVFNAAAGVVGSKLAQRFVNRLEEWQIFVVPIALIVVGLGVMSIHFSIMTIWFYLLAGVAQGWTSASMMPMVQKYAEPSEQTSVVSLASVVSSLLYIPAVWLIGVAADVQTTYSMLATLVIFVPLSIPILLKLKRES